MAYLPLSTANLPDPVIDPAQGSSPEDYFNTVTYTGNSLNPASVTGVGFQPDFVWVKTRSFGNTNHRLQDVVRGSNKRLMSDLTNAEIDTAGGIQSFDADGFTVGDGTSKDGFIHFGGRTFVAWNWKANGSGVSNTDGSITSTVSANTESGFSVLTYTGNGTNGATIGHGLGATPTFFIVKRRDGTGWSWYTYHKDGKGALGSLYLNSTGAGDTDSTHWNNTIPSSSVITLGTSNGINQSSGTYVCYAFAPVDGFSKFGSYTGNNSYPNSGPFIYLGFRPSWVMIKGTASGRVWMMYDNKRLGYNIDNNDLRAEQSGTEGTGDNIALLSNGFQIVNQSSNGQVNGSGETYIYMAFAENPFKYSNAR